jgi:hypothetical protein
MDYYTYKEDYIMNDMKTDLKNYFDYWLSIPKDYINSDETYEISQIKIFCRDLDEILADPRKNLSEKKLEFINYCDENILIGQQNIDSNFRKAVGQMFDQTIKDLKWSNTKRTLAMPITAATRLVCGVIGLGLRLGGNALMIAGKALEAGTLGIINKIPGLSAQVDIGIALTNRVLPLKKGMIEKSTDGSHDILTYEGKKELEGTRLNAAQVLGTSLVGLGSIMMNSHVNPDQKEQHLKKFVEKVKAQREDRNRHRREV